jgi:subtilase family serine protease
VVIDKEARTISAAIHNVGSTAGPATVGFFLGSPENGGSLLALATARRVEPGESARVTVTVGALPPGGVTVAIDPYDVIGELDESNNNAFHIPSR